MTDERYAMLRACLYEIDFPATQREIVRAAVSDGVDPQLVHTLQSLPGMTYRSGYEILALLSSMSESAGPATTKVDRVSVAG